MELVESFSGKDDDIAAFWVAEGRALVKDKVVTISMARDKSSRKFGGNRVCSKGFQGVPRGLQGAQDLLPGEAIRLSD